MHLIIADLDLTSCKGHCFAYNKSLHDAQLRSLLNCTILSSKNISASTLEQLPSTPTFSLTSGFRPKASFIQKVLSPYRQNYLLAKTLFSQHNRQLYQDLTNITPSLQVSNNHFVLFHTIVPPQINPIIEWLESFPASKAPSVGLLFRFPSSGNSKNPRIHPDLVSQSFKRIEASKVTHKIHLLSDSQPLIEELKSITKKPAALLPIPHIPEVHHSISPSNTVHIGYLGEARPDKGFHLLPELITAILKTPNIPKTTFTIQINPQTHTPKNCLLAEAKLRNLPAKIIDNTLSDQDYLNTLQTLDAVLLPYSTKIYSKQTSGIFSEALGAGILPLIPSNTWMHEQLKKLQLDISINFSSPHSYHTQLAHILKNFPSIQEKMVDIRSEWKNIHNADRFLSIIRNLHKL